MAKFAKIFVMCVLLILSIGLVHAEVSDEDLFNPLLRYSFRSEDTNVEQRFLTQSDIISSTAGTHDLRLVPLSGIIADPFLTHRSRLYSNSSIYIDRIISEGNRRTGWFEIITPLESSDPLYEAINNRSNDVTICSFFSVMPGYNSAGAANPINIFGLGTTEQGSSGLGLRKASGSNNFGNSAFHSQVLSLNPTALSFTSTSSQPSGWGAWTLGCLDLIEDPDDSTKWGTRVRHVEYINGIPVLSSGPGVFRAKSDHPFNYNRIRLGSWGATGSLAVDIFRGQFDEFLFYDTLLDDSSLISMFELLIDPHNSISISKSIDVLNSDAEITYAIDANVTKIYSWRVNDVIEKTDVPREGLLAYYSFENGDFRDVTNNNNHNIFMSANASIYSESWRSYIYGTPDWGAENPNIAPENALVGVPLSSNNPITTMPIDSEFSAAFWVYVPYSESVTATPIWRPSHNSQLVYQIELTSGVLPKVRIGHGGTDNHIVNTYHSCEGCALSRNSWHHLTVTYNGTDILLYKDGILISPISVSLGSFSSGGPSQVSIGRIGSLGYGIRMDNLLLYDRVLTPDEVENIVSVQPFNNRESFSLDESHNDSLIMLEVDYLSPTTGFGATLHSNTLLGNFEPPELRFENLSVEEVGFGLQAVYNISVDEGYGVYKSYFVWDVDGEISKASLIRKGLTSYFPFEGSREDYSNQGTVSHTAGKSILVANESSFRGGYAELTGTTGSLEGVLETSRTHPAYTEDIVAFSAWVYVPADCGPNDNVGILQKHAVSGVNSFSASLVHCTLPRVRFNDDNDFRYYDTANVPTIKGSWNHFAASWYGQNNVSYFVNGVKQTATFTGTVSPGSATAGLFVGGSTAITGVKYDEIMTFNEPLSESEMVALFRGGRSESDTLRSQLESFTPDNITVTAGSSSPDRGFSLESTSEPLFIDQLPYPEFDSFFREYLVIQRNLTTNSQIVLLNGTYNDNFQGNLRYSVNGVDLGPVSLNAGVFEVSITIPSGNHVVRIFDEARPESGFAEIENFRIGDVYTMVGQSNSHLVFPPLRDDGVYDAQCPWPIPRTRTQNYNGSDFLWHEDPQTHSQWFPMWDQMCYQNNVPVMVIMGTIGGTPIEDFVDRDGLRVRNGYVGLMQQLDTFTRDRKVHTMFYYQSESNAGSPNWGDSPSFYDMIVQLNEYYQQDVNIQSGRFVVGNPWSNHIFGYIPQEQIQRAWRLHEDDGIRMGLSIYDANTSDPNDTVHFKDYYQEGAPLIFRGMVMGLYSAHDIGDPDMPILVDAVIVDANTVDLVYDRNIKIRDFQDNASNLAWGLELYNSRNDDWRRSRTFTMNDVTTTAIRNGNTVRYNFNTDISSAVDFSFCRTNYCIAQPIVRSATSSWPVLNPPLQVYSVPINRSVMGNSANVALRSRTDSSIDYAERTPVGVVDIDAFISNRKTAGFTLNSSALKDVSNITILGDSSKSVIHVSDDSPHVTDKILYIPAVSNSGKILICPNATTLAGVFEGCPNQEIVTTTAVNGFYEVPVTGTGGMEAPTELSTGALNTCKNIDQVVRDSFSLATIALIVLAAASIIGILSVAFGGGFQASNVNLVSIISLIVVSGVMLVIGAIVFAIVTGTLCI